MNKGQMRQQEIVGFNWVNQNFNQLAHTLNRMQYDVKYLF